MDDGTLDTVLRCAHCGETFRFQYADDGWLESYATWLEYLIAETEAEHECHETPTN